MKSNIEIADEALRLVDRVIRNELPTESCPVKEERAKWKREEVRAIIVSKLQPAVDKIGPSQAVDKIGPKEVK